MSVQLLLEYPLGLKSVVIIVSLSLRVKICCCWINMLYIKGVQLI